jgi:hypothetical protein
MNENKKKKRYGNCLIATVRSLVNGLVRSQGDVRDQHVKKSDRLVQRLTFSIGHAPALALAAASRSKQGGPRRRVE